MESKQFQAFRPNPAAGDAPKRKVHFLNREVSVSISRVFIATGGEGFLVTTTDKGTDAMFSSNNRTFCGTLQETDDHLNSTFAEFRKSLIEGMER